MINSFRKSQDNGCTWRLGEQGGSHRRSSWTIQSLWRTNCAHWSRYFKENISVLWCRSIDSHSQHCHNPRNFFPLKRNFLLQNCRRKQFPDRSCKGKESGCFFWIKLTARLHWQIEIDYFQVTCWRVWIDKMFLSFSKLDALQKESSDLLGKTETVKSALENCLSTKQSDVSEDDLVDEIDYIHM